MKDRFSLVLAFLASFALAACSGNSQAEFEMLMRVPLPASAQIESRRTQGDYALFIVHLPKADFPAFARSLSPGYSSWYPVERDISGEVFNKEQSFSPKNASQYAVRFQSERGGPGTFPVLVWNEATETLTAMMAGAWGG